MTSISESELLEIFRARVTAWGRDGRKHIKTFAYEHGYAPITVNNTLTGRYAISDRMARALGYRRVVSVSFIPITNPSDPRPDRGGPNGRINDAGRPASIEGEA